MGETEPAEVVEAVEVVEEPSPEELEKRHHARGKKRLKEQFSRWGVEIESGENRGDWILTRGETIVALKEESRIALVNGVRVFLDTPFAAERGRISVGDTDFDNLFSVIFGERPVSAPLKTIVIDPGHGGTDEGTKNSGLALLEKELNLDVCQRLQKHLEALGFKAVLTRYDDRFVELDERPKIASNVKADLFVSVHFNAATNKDAAGIETYVLPGIGQDTSSGKPVSGVGVSGFPGNVFDQSNMRLALEVQGRLVEQLRRTDRGVKKERFAVLRSLECPGVLVECGFLSNEEEALLMSTAGYRERLARSIADAIAAYGTLEDES